MIESPKMKGNRTQLSPQLRNIICNTYTFCAFCEAVLKNGIEQGRQKRKKHSTTTNGD